MRNVELMVISLGASMLLLLMLALLTRLYLNQGSLTGLLSDELAQQVKMLRLQYLSSSLLGALIYITLVLSTGEYPPIPYEIALIIGLSSMGYLGGKGLNVYRGNDTEAI